MPAGRQEHIPEVDVAAVVGVGVEVRVQIKAAADRVDRCTAGVDRVVRGQTRVGIGAAAGRAVGLHLDRPGVDAAAIAGGILVAVEIERGVRRDAGVSVGVGDDDDRSGLHVAGHVRSARIREIVGAQVDRGRQVFAVHLRRVGGQQVAGADAVAGPHVDLLSADVAAVDAATAGLDRDVVSGLDRAGHDAGGAVDPDIAGVGSQRCGDVDRAAVGARVERQRAGQGQGVIAALDEDAGGQRRWCAGPPGTDARFDAQVAAVAWERADAVDQVVRSVLEADRVFRLDQDLGAAEAVLQLAFEYGVVEVAAAVGDGHVDRIDQQRAAVSQIHGVTDLYPGARELDEAAPTDGAGAVAGVGNADRSAVSVAEGLAGDGLDMAAVAAAGVECAADVDVATVGDQVDLAAAFLDACRRDAAAVIDGGGTEQIAGGGRGCHHGAAGGDDVAGVVDAGKLGDRRSIDRIADQAFGVELQRQLRTRRENHVPVRRFDDAAVADVVSGQDDEPAVGAADPAGVVDAGLAVAREHELPGQEVVVADVERAGDQRADVDAAAGAEHDPLRIDQEHLAVGVELAEDLRRQIADHAIENRCRGSRLVELDVFAAADRERLPVDDRRVGVLVDDQRVVVRRGQRHVTVHDIRAGRVGDRRAEGQQQPATQDGGNRIEAELGHGRHLRKSPRRSRTRVRSRGRR